MSVSDKICGQNQNTHFISNIFFPTLSYRISDNVEKYGDRHATDNNIIGILDNY